MSQFEIVYLESYRKRRVARYRRAVALHGQDPERARVLELLWRALGIVGGDRGAVVWLDEYGPGLVHPHTLLDLGSDRPRRFFPSAPLRSAWESRIPAFWDLHNGNQNSGDLWGGVASSSLISLGSDGPRSWSLVLESPTPRPALSPTTTNELMFLAGEVASVILHQDLGVEGPKRRLIAGEALGSREPPEAFSGWAVLKDLEGRKREEEYASHCVFPSL